MDTRRWGASWALGVLLAVAGAGPAGAQQGARIDIAKVGPQIGQQVPAFSLRDQTAKTWTLQSLMGRNGLMLVFSRSADWCPYCKTQMVELQGRLPDLRARGLGLAVITYDPQVVTADFAQRRNITYPLLSDVGSPTIKAYGLLNTTIEQGTSAYGIPFPGTLIVDRQGRVTARFFEEAYQERNTVSTIMLALGNGITPVSASRAQTEQVEVTSYLSDPVVAPGTMFSLVFDIVPRKGMHVYAPGASGYKVVAFRLDPNPALLTRPVSFPPSEVYEFKPLNERVQVYRRPFRVVQTLGVSATPQTVAALANGTSLTITGTLEYQACDDAVCYPPRSIPVSHTVRLRQLDRERATPSGPR